MKIITAIILMMLGFTFYWYEWRPTQVRKGCFNTSQDFPKDSQDSFYRNCVMGNGINP